MDSLLFPSREAAIEHGVTRFDASAAYLVMDADRRRGYAQVVAREAFRRRADEWLRTSFDPLLLQCAFASACALDEPPSRFLETCARRIEALKAIDQSWFVARSRYERLLSSGRDVDRAVPGWSEADMALMAPLVGDGERMARSLMRAREPIPCIEPFVWREEIVARDIPIVGRDGDGPYVVLDGVGYEIARAAYGLRRSDVREFAETVLPHLRHNDLAYAREGMPVEFRVELGCGEAMVRGYSSERAAQMIDDDYQRMCGAGRAMVVSPALPDPEWVHGIADCFRKRAMIVDAQRASEVRERLGQLWNAGAQVPQAAISVEDAYLCELWPAQVKAYATVTPIRNASVIQVDRGTVERSPRSSEVEFER